MCRGERIKDCISSSRGWYHDPTSRQLHCYILKFLDDTFLIDAKGLFDIDDLTGSSFASPVLLLSVLRLESQKLSCGNYGRAPSHRPRYDHRTAGRLGKRKSKGQLRGYTSSIQVCPSSCPYVHGQARCVCKTSNNFVQTRVGACALREGDRHWQRLGICRGIAARQVNRCSGPKGPGLSHSCCNVQAW